MTTLTLAPDLKLPLSLVTESVAILARKRAGKSHTAKRLVEQLHAAGQQIVIVDPKGDWWGIRSSKDGKGPGLPIVILGGEHGDVPLEVGAGELVARMVVQDRLSVLLDIASFRKHEMATFMTAFLETLYRLKGKEVYRTPMMLVLEEADQIAPQKPYKGQERMLGAASDIVRLGGQRGIGIFVVTQRTAVLNKDVLTQAGILVLLQTTGSQDIDAVDDWIKKHGQPEERAKVLATIASMPRGTAWVWAPGWPDEKGIFRQVQVMPCETFDSGATPKPGEKRIAPKTLADVDLEAFRREMAATIEKAKAEDPKALREKIAQLEAENRKLQRATQQKTEAPVADKATLRAQAATINGLRKALEAAMKFIITISAQSFDVAGVDKGELEKAVAAAVERAAKLVDDRLKARGDQLQRLHDQARQLVKTLKVATETPDVELTVDVIKNQPFTVLDAESKHHGKKSGNPPADGLDGTQQRILDTIRMLNARGLPVTKDAVARWLGIHPNGSRYNRSLASLRADSYCNGLLLTERGQQAAQDMPTGVEAAMAALSEESQRRVFQAIIDQQIHGLTLSKEELAAKLGIHPNGSRYNRALAWLRTMGVISERGPIIVHDGVFR